MKRYKNIAFIIPSYNESDNLRILLKKIFKIYPNSWVYIVDDSNKIERKKTVKNISKYRNVNLISRQSKSGRGSAVMMGFRKALERKTIRYFIEMDSDLAHDPAEIARFLNKNNKEKYDLIIGSRYLPGGRIVHITKDRTILSRVINIFLKLWLNVKVTDFTSGFRFYSKKSVVYLTKQKIKSKGFITLSETLYLINKSGFKIGEVPITWNHRVYGTSNVNNKELIMSLLFVLRLRVVDLLNNLKFW